VKTIIKQLFLLALVIITNQSYAQDKLQTIETTYARIHFEQDYQAFAQQVATKFDEIYLAVNQRVGFEQNEKLDLLIADDFHQANGYAVPLASGKIIKLLTSAPRSEEVLAYYNDWLNLLISHELTHKVHISAPSRSWRSSLDKHVIAIDLSNFNRYPRWISEGYATLIETQYTKQGRVNSDYVRALLQQWAVEGQLPTYQEINGNDNYMGNGMAYIQGSAFLLWLQNKFGDDKLSQLWRRSTATQYRDFNQAFKGLFLQSPQRLYKAFVAEQTYLAKLAQENSHESGTLWQNNDYKVLSHQLSPKQNELLQLEQDSDGFTRLNVYSFDDNKKAQDDFAQNNEGLLKSDPLDVVDTTPVVFNRESKYSIKASRKKGWRQARWLTETTALVLQYQLQDNLELGFELAKVNLVTGGIELITQSLRLHDYTVTPDKKSVIALSHFAGFNQLIKVSIEDGSWQALTDKMLNVSMDNLTLSANGEQLALMAIDNSGKDKQWQIHLFDLNTKKWQVVELLSASPLLASKSQSNFLSHLNWQGDWLYFSRSEKNNHDRAINIYRTNIKTKIWQQLTQGSKISTKSFVVNHLSDNISGNSSGNNSVNSTDNKEQLFYLKTTSQGQQTYSQNISKDQLANQSLSQGKIKLHTTEKQSAFTPSPERATNDYGIGPQAFSFDLLGYLSNDDSGLDVVARGGDPLGRLRYQAAYSYGEQQQNAALFVKSHWLNVDWFAELVDNQFDDVYQRKSKAINAELAYQHHFDQSQRLKAQFGLGAEQISQATYQDELSYYRMQGRYTGSYESGALSYGLSLGGLLTDYRGDNDNWQRVDYDIAAKVRYKNSTLVYQYKQNEVDDNAPSYAQLVYGGQTTSASSQVVNSQMLDSRLPLAWQMGYLFEQHNISFYSDGAELYYLSHKTDKQDALAAYGFQINTGINHLSPLLDGLTIKLGFTWYEMPLGKKDNQYFLSLGYQFK
jgi:hypothetical protein